MKSYIMKRVLSMLPTLFVISVILFSLMKCMPQDPVALAMPSYVKPAQYEVVYEQIKEDLGLNDSLLIQYGRWIKNTMRGNLGTSIIYKRPVAQVIQKPLLHTLLLNGLVLMVSMSCAFGFGIYSALHAGNKVDKVFQASSVVGMSMPTFFIALLLLYVLSFQLHLLPSGGMPLRGAGLLDWMKSLCLPVVSLSIVNACMNYRYIRNSMLEVLSSEYILAAKAKGLPRKRVIYHGFRAALLPILSVFMAQVATLLFGSVLIESIFSYDGIGSILIQALQRRDYMLALNINLIYTIVYLGCNLGADILYAYVDPRVRYS